MKVTTEKLPKSLLALDIELDKDQVEKGLDRAARLLSNKYNIPGFRKGKAPRFIVENYFGRDALVEQATDELINKSYKTALEQESITPIGKASIDNVHSSDPFRFRVLVPVAPTVTIPEYRSIRFPLDVQTISDETVQQALDGMREKHVVLRELEEPRPAQQGDQLSVKLESFLDGEPLEARPDDDEVRTSTLVLEPGEVVEALYEALVGAEVGSTIEVATTMPEDHDNDQVRGKEVTFKAQIEGIQERLPADWDELPVLENFDGSLDELRQKTRTDLETTATNVAERAVIDGFVEQVVSGTEYDLPDLLIHERAHELLHEQAQQFERYGITLDQMLQYRGKSHDEATQELYPEAEQQLKQTLALQAVMANEGLRVSNDEISTEVARIVLEYPEAERERATAMLSSQLRGSVASSVLDRRLRERIMAIAAGEAPSLEQGATGDAEVAEKSAADAEQAVEPEGVEQPAADAEQAVEPGEAVESEETSTRIAQQTL